jgi:hypothetical protein
MRTELGRGAEEMHMEPSAIWDLVRNWELVLPPLRPSAEQLARIGRHIDGVDRHSPVAVLGSTPEFRDLLHEMGFTEIHVFDRSRRFYDAFTRLRARKSREALEEGDWLDTLGRFRGRFGVVLSDLTSGHMPYERRREFYGLITDALCEGGLFCDKVLAHRQPLLTLEGLMDKYAHRPLNLLYINSFVCEVFFCSELLRLRGVVDSTLFYEVLRDHARTPRLRAFVTMNKQGMPPGSFWYYGRPWSELAPEYCPALLAIEEADEETWSPFYGQARHVVLRKPVRSV